MAKPKVRSGGPTPRSERDLSRLLFLERVRGPIIPGVLSAVGVLVWVLANAGLLGIDAAILSLGGVFLALCLFFGLRSFIHETTPAARWGALVAFAAVFAAATFYPLVRTIVLPPPIVAGDLEPGGRPIEVRPAGSDASFRIVVDGHLPPSADRSSQSAHYRMTAELSGGSPIDLEGDFSDKWGMRRLGRRGSAPVHYARSSTHHDVDVASGQSLTLKLDSLVPPTSHNVTVTVYPNSLSPVLFIGLGVVATVGAIVVDAWRSADAGDGLMSLLTLGAIFGVASFRRFAPSHPGLGDLIFNAAVGGAVGAALGSLLWRIVRRPLRERLG